MISRSRTKSSKAAAHIALNVSWSRVGLLFLIFSHVSAAVRRSQGKGKVEKEVKKSVKQQSIDKAAQKNKTMQKLKTDRDRKREQKKQGALAPRVVLLLSFSSDHASSVKLKAELASHCSAKTDELGPLTVNPPSLGKHSKFTLMSLDTNSSVFDVLEACLVADVLVPVVDAVTGVSEVGVRLGSVIKAQGLMAVLPVITGMGAVAPGLRHATKKGLLEDLKYLFPNVSRVLPADESEGDLVQVFRFLDQQRLSELHFRNPRSFVLAEQVQFEVDPGQAAAMGTLRLSGFVRGGVGLSCDSLMHVPGLGDMQLDKVTDAVSGAVLHTATELRPSLQAENEPDPFAGGEQTWPTEADVAMAGASDDDVEGEEDGAALLAEAVKGRKLRRRVPAGMSEYQAAWIPDSGDEEEEEDDQGSGGEQMEESSGGGDGGPEDGGRRRVVDSDDDGSEGGGAAMDDQDDDEEDGPAQKERDEQRWPDEVEAPVDVPARERFQKYRGLDSFRTAAWFVFCVCLR